MRETLEKLLYYRNYLQNKEEELEKYKDLRGYLYIEKYQFFKGLQQVIEILENGELIFDLTNETITILNNIVQKEEMGIEFEGFFCRSLDRKKGIVYIKDIIDRFCMRVNVEKNVYKFKPVYANLIIEYYNERINSTKWFVKEVEKFEAIKNKYKELMANQRTK